MAFQVLQRFQTGSERFDVDLRSLQVLEQEGETWLYACTGINGGISLFQLTAASAPPQLLQRYWHQNAELGTGVFTLGEIGGEQQLLQQGSSSGALLRYGINGNGTLRSQESEALTTGSEGGLGVLALGQISSGALAGHSLVYGLTESGELRGWRLDSNGVRQADLATTGEAAAYHLAGSAALEILAEADLLFALDPGGAGLRSYRIDPASGALEAADQLGQAAGLAVSDPRALESFRAQGSDWIVLASAGSSSLSLIRVEQDGRLTLADQLNDTLATRFGGAAHLQVVQHGDHVLVLAAGHDDGISLLRLLPSGQLLYLDSLSADEAAGLQAVTALESVVLGDQLQLYVSSGSHAGLARLALDLGDLGQQASLLTGAGRLQGGAGDDLLQGGTGAVLLEGGAGDDILVASGAGSQLTGGAGADRFVLGAIAAPGAAPGGGSLRVMDFTPGEDLLDLSLCPGLYSPAQLQLESLPGGIALRFAATRIEVQNALGQALTLEDLWPTGRFDQADRLGGGSPAGGDIDYGGGTADLLVGSGGADRIWGLGGDDDLRGLGGGDEMLGGDGQDTLRGSWGADTLYGELGDDMVLGGGGTDLLYGNEGADDVQGHKENDTLWGGQGNDSLKGNMGVDRLYGGLGNDDIRGGTENDQLWGEEGADLLVGQAGADSLMGESGNDTLKGGADPDWAWGYNGDDSFNGGRGRDHLFGGNGNDSLSGDMGGDWLTGGEGADSFLFGKVHGQDEISDFTPGEDLIDLSAMAVEGDGFEDLEISETSRGALVVTGNGQILLEGVALAEVTADLFVF